MVEREAVYGVKELDSELQRTELLQRCRIWPFADLRFFSKHIALALSGFLSSSVMNRYDFGVRACQRNDSWPAA